MSSPFIVLHVCMGNICRSPMAERLLAHAVAGRDAEHLVLSESVGTGSWHAGEPMNRPAAAEMARRGVAHESFRARQLTGAHIDTADLVLTATSEQLDFVLGLRADALPRAFVLGEFGRLAAAVDPALLPAATSMSIHARGTALVEAVSEARGGSGPRPGDDLDDPYGRSTAFFTGTADQIVSSLEPLVDALLPKV